MRITYYWYKARQFAAKSYNLGRLVNHLELDFWHINTEEEIDNMASAYLDKARFQSFFFFFKRLINFLCWFPWGKMMTTDVVGIMTSYINSSQHSGLTWTFLWLSDELTTRTNQQMFPGILGSSEGKGRG
jgi:hypothetical protein